MEKGFNNFIRFRCQEAINGKVKDGSSSESNSDLDINDCVEWYKAGFSDALKIISSDECLPRK